MSPASYLAAPPRVARERIPNAPRYDESVPWWTWVALAFFVVVAMVAGVVAAVLTARALRRARALQAVVDDDVERLLEAVEAVEARLAAVEERRTLVERRVEALRRSVEKLSVLQWALSDTRSAVTRLRRAVPKK